MKKKHIIAVHLLNDFSGSPFVLRQSIELLVRQGYTVDLLTATPQGKGFLSDIPGVRLHALPYRWSTNRWKTLLFYLWSQLRLFVCVSKMAGPEDLVYINSLLPFGAALAAKLRRAKLLYHIHEVSIQPALLKRWLLWVAGHTASIGLFVSDDLRKRTVWQKPAQVVYNALPADFIQQAILAPKTSSNQFRVLMLCSLKAYKGVWEFVQLANRLPNMKFRLVLNATPAAIDAFFQQHRLPPNLVLFPAQSDVHRFYADTDVVMNLSHPDGWIETFGMTILEAMYYRKPVIVPPVGGVLELVNTHVEGYSISAHDTDALCEALRTMQACPSLYNRMQAAAFRKATTFSPARFNRELIRAIRAVQSPEMVSPNTVRPMPTLFSGIPAME